MVLGSWTFATAKPVQKRKLPWATLAVATHPGGADLGNLVPRRRFKSLPYAPGSGHTAILTRAALTL
eukprot:9469193-Pyramimonas_sp.AAC.1